MRTARRALAVLPLLALAASLLAAPMPRVRVTLIRWPYT